MNLNHYLMNEYGVSGDIINFVQRITEKIEKDFDKSMTDIMDFNQMKILNAMKEFRLASTDFHWTTGYGYGDYGRDKVEEIYAKIFQTEEALVRPNIVSGTHAIFLTLNSLLQPNDTLLSLCGPLYDTMQKAIGLTGDIPGSLIEKGVKYKEVPLKKGKMQVEFFQDYIDPSTKVVAIQRSTGYSNRSAFTLDDIEKAIQVIKDISSDIIIFVDNCYGEFTNYKEPSELGAHIMAGSLIKNPGGGLAFSGGYIVGKKELITRITNNLTAPGIGGDCGLTFGMTRQILQGLFIAPKVVYDAMKGARLFAAAFEELGYVCVPRSKEERSDIIQGIQCDSPEKLECFCESIQSISPVDAHFTPTASYMPGYEDKVIMAAGGFIEGSSIELSADGPLREPYMAFLQGGLTFSHCKLALMYVLSQFEQKGYIELKNSV
ncbi:MAG: methionine gamma-lyase family protein [Tissierellia bacterium]|nr:methionine gamma-lyase family protein [Tissierellia bacterium]